MKKPVADAPPSYVSAGAGTMFAAMVIAGFALGYAIDVWLETRPWAMILTGLLGMVGGFVRVHEMLSKTVEKSPRDG